MILCQWTELGAVHPGLPPLVLVSLILVSPTLYSSLLFSSILYTSQYIPPFTSLTLSAPPSFPTLVSLSNSIILSSFSEPSYLLVVYYASSTVL